MDTRDYIAELFSIVSDPNYKKDTLLQNNFSETTNALMQHLFSQQRDKVKNAVATGLGALAGTGAVLGGAYGAYKNQDKIEALMDKVGSNINIPNKYHQTADSGLPETPRKVVITSQEDIERERQLADAQKAEAEEQQAMEDAVGNSIDRALSMDEPFNGIV